MAQSNRVLFSSLSLATMMAVSIACQRVPDEVVEEAEATPPPASCEIPDTNLWLYDTMQHVYLWNEHLPDMGTAQVESYETTALLLDDLRYADIDRWSYIRNAQVSNDHYQKGKGLSFGHKTVRDADDNKWVTYVNDPSPAWDAGLRRGDLILADDYLDEDKLILALHVRQPDGTEREFQIKKGEVVYDTVPFVSHFASNDAPHGYLMFRTFVEPAVEALDAAFAEFREQGITRVIVDLRYNGGGLISVARHLGNLLLGLANEGSVSFSYEYNENQASENRSYKFEVVDKAIATTEVVFIVGPSTASASELVVNMVRPYVKTTIVGNTTGGKPVGMHSHKFCEDKLSPIEFRMINVEGYGGYYDGIVPDCVVEDDVAHELGTAQEARIAESLVVLETGACTTARTSQGDARSNLVADLDDDDLMPGALEPLDR